MIAFEVAGVPAGSRWANRISMHSDTWHPCSQIAVMVHGWHQTDPGGCPERVRVWGIRGIEDGAEMSVAELQAHGYLRLDEL